MSKISFEQTFDQYKKLFGITWSTLESLYDKHYNEIHEFINSHRDDKEFLCEVYGDLCDREYDDEIFKNRTPYDIEFFLGLRYAIISWVGRYNCDKYYCTVYIGKHNKRKNQSEKDYDRAILEDMYEYYRIKLAEEGIL